jgi:hypothetical protein
LPSNQALCDRELDLEMAEVLSPRETLTTPINIVVTPTVVVTPAVALAVAVQAATIGSNNFAAVIQNLHV